MAYKAIIAGASGLVGGELLSLLLKQPEYDEVLVLVRELLPFGHVKMKQQVVDFNQLDKYSDKINGHALFSCLGSTRKKTADLTDYRKIDHDYPLQLAQLARQNGIEQFHLVSSIGANAAASNFYTKMKGETENDIKAVGLNSLFIYQPSVLVGKRNEFRFAERMAVGVMKVINPLMMGSLKKYRSIKAATIAQAMYKQSLTNQTGTFVYESDKIKELA